MDANQIKYFIEAALLAAGRPLSIDQLQKLFDGRSVPERSEIRQAVTTLNEEYDSRGILIAEVASGFRVQVKAGMADQLAERCQAGVHMLGLSPAEEHLYLLIAGLDASEEFVA